MYLAARNCPRKRQDRGPAGLQAGARQGARGLRTLIAAVVLALATPAHAGAHSSEAPPSDERARLEAIYGAANEATQAGDFAAAADRYAEVLALLVESRETHESRALALLDSVAARRQAHARSHDPAQLCRARTLVRDYLAAADAAHGLAAHELDGVRQALQLRDELDAQLAEATCPEDQPVAEVPPPRAPPLRLAPAPVPGPDPRVIAGAALLGAGGLCLALFATGLGVGAHAESRLRDERAADPGRDIDALLAEGLIQRGRAGNRLAVVGGVLAGVTLVAGAALMALAKTRPRTRVAVGPGGLGLRF
ncbi:MAG: hypothetical protein IPO88_11830 [Nannocystis sp.]|uniref:hypothetical protein n=1 Tax=Nannocystis sp. TaxID=1962667 RepID=UPI002421712A|nr:hypothetical protein [Nannocystis sp.]MBK9754174.1 hypothetical protein [Nannocystis sp.]